MIQVFHPNRVECDRMAEIMGNGVTGNALRQRIAKLRNKNPISSGGGATTVATPTSTTKKGGKNKKAANTEIEDDDDEEYAAKTPSKKGRAPARARGGGGRKRGRAVDNDGDGEESKGTSSSAAKKAKTIGKVKQEQVPEVEDEDELKIEHEELAGDAGDVGVVAANPIMGGMVFGGFEDDEAEPLLGQGSFFYLQDEDEEVV